MRAKLKVDLEICETYGGRMKVIAAIENPAVIKRILNIRHARRRNSHWPA